MARVTKMRAHYVIARNPKKRPTLMHKVGRNHSKSACGLDMSLWSRSFSEQPIDVMVCLKCKRLP